MHQELADFLDYCRVERRFAPLTARVRARRQRLYRLPHPRGNRRGRRGAIGGPAALPGRRSIRRPSPSSQARTVAALKCFFRFLLENERLDRDPAQVLRTPKRPRRYRTCSTAASSPGYLMRQSATTSGSEGMTVSVSAIDCCWRCSPVRACGAASLGLDFAGRRPRTPPAVGAQSEGRGNGHCRSIPRSSRCSSTT